jgi:hypothetical protein
MSVHLNAAGGAATALRGSHRAAGQPPRGAATATFG